MKRNGRGVILPVVLFILLLLGLLVGTFAFKVNADVASMRAAQYQFRTRLAAEAGVEKVKLMLRFGRLDRQSWWDNMEELNRIIVYTDSGDNNVLGTDEEFNKLTQTYRFSIVGDDPLDDEDFCRFGVTDEQSKINLNKATRNQLLSLVTGALGDDEKEVDPNEIVDAILDWRDPDQMPRGTATDAEGEYYKELPKPYNVKNGPFDTVEELLLVKGVTPAILYGEDVDRNGLLTENEDDGEATFPMDNEDGRLNRGIYPFLTVLSYDNNTSNDNRQRIYLKGDQNKVREELTEEFPDDPQVVDYVINTVRNANNQGGRGGQQGGRGNQQGGGGGGALPGQQGGQSQSGGKPGQQSGQDGSGKPGEQSPTGGPNLDPGKGPGRPPREGNPDPNQQPPRPPRNQNPRPSKSDVVKQARPGQPVAPPRSGQMNPNGSGPQPIPTGGQADPSKGGQDPEGNPAGAGEANGNTGEGAAGGNPNQPGGQGQPQGGSNNGASVTAPMRSPADLFRKPSVNGVEQEIPLLPEHLAKLLDRTTLDAPDKKMVGLINVNTAPPEVLRTVEPLTEEQVKAIVSTREGLSSEELATPAWLVTQNVVDMATFQTIAPSITARGTQFTIEALGFADHVGTVTRLQVVVDMLGPIPQTVYYRDASGLGASFPIREEDKERRHGK